MNSCYFLETKVPEMSYHCISYKCGLKYPSQDK